MQITIKVEGLEALKSSLAGKSKQIRFATAVALTRTAKAVEDRQRHEMRDVFDRPTPTTLNSLYVKPATAQSLIAKVGIKDFAGKGVAASKYLAAQIKGGDRHMKRFEKALMAVGAMPGKGFRAVPGSAAKLDAYGNMQGGQIVQILSFFKAFPEAGYKANMTDKRRASLAKGTKNRQGFAYFVSNERGSTRHLPFGIWQRFGFSSGSAIKPVIIFVPSATYEAVFDFDYVARTTVDRSWSAEFGKALASALSTSR